MARKSLSLYTEKLSNKGQKFSEKVPKIFVLGQKNSENFYPRTIKLDQPLDIKSKACCKYHAMYFVVVTLLLQL